MTSRAQNAAVEDWGAACVAETLSASHVVRRDEGGEQIRDFDLVFADGHCEPLEVTLHADEPIMRGHARMKRHDFALAANLTQVWLVSPSYARMDAAGKNVAYDMRECERRLPPVIERLEQAGLTEFDVMAFLWDPQFCDDARVLMHLGIDHARAYLPSDERDVPRIQLAPSSGGALGENAVAAAVEAEACDLGNQKKLAARSDAPRRHLFVALTGMTDDLALWALFDILTSESPRLPRSPDLPAAITTVWAAAPAGGLFVTPPAAWQIFRPSADVRQRLAPN